MVKAYRLVGRTQTPRYKQLKEKLIKLGKRDGEITSRNFAASVGIFCVSSARKWLVVFEADGVIILTTRRCLGGEKVYVLSDSCIANLREVATRTTNNTQP